MSKVEAMLPQLRFEGFSGEWKIVKLGDIANIKRGASPRPISDPVWFDENSSIGWVRISDVTKSNGVLKETTQYLSQKGIEKSRFIPSGNLIMSICATIGRPIYTGIDVCIHDGFVVFDNLKADLLCLLYILQLIEKNWQRYGQPGAQVNLNSDIVSQEKIKLPNLEEQTKIGELFQKLDRAIELQQQKVEQSERYKKAMLQKMFPQKGETEPQLRFEGFSGEWECQRLDELVFFSKGKGYSKSDLCESGVEIILYGSLYTNYQTTISKVHTFAEDKGNSVYSEGVEVLLPSSGETSVDIARASAVLKKGIILGGDLNILKPKREYNSTFLALNLTYSSANRELIKRAQGQVVVHLYNSDIAGVKLMLPTLEEQTKIGEFFQALDMRIEVETKKLNHYESLKKAMLQRMFV